MCVCARVCNNILRMKIPFCLICVYIVVHLAASIRTLPLVCLFCVYGFVLHVKENEKKFLNLSENLLFFLGILLVAKPSAIPHTQIDFV